jgi:hypothetical protein
MAALEGSRFNEFAYWRGIEAKLATELSRPAAGGSSGEPGVSNILTPDA